MSIARMLPRSRETAEETKARAYREYGVVVIDVDKDTMSWELRELVQAWARNRYGDRRKSA